MNTDWKQAATTNIDNAVQAAFAQRLPPDQAWAKLDAARRTAMQFGHFEAKELDPMIYDAIRRRSGDDPNWALAVGSAPRVDLNDPSKTVPALFDKAEYLSQKQSLVQRAQAFNTNADEAAQKQNVNNAVAQAFNSGDAATVNALPPDLPYLNRYSGAEGSVSKDTALKAAVSARINTDNQRVASGRATPSQVFDELLAEQVQGWIRQREYPESARGLETHRFIHHSLHSGTIDIGIIMAALSADVAVSLDRGE